MHTFDEELDRQRDVAVALAAASRSAIDPAPVKELVAALREPLRSVAGQAAETSSSCVPFVLVVSEQIARAEDLVPSLRLVGSDQPGVVDRNHGDDPLADYRPIRGLAVPPSSVYALVDVQRGEEFCAVRPEDALPVITARGRTPLTIHEGISLVAQFPAVLEKNRCFMLSGSRRGDRRVPALWISERAPKLGWCWDGNPHSWLGTASTARRLAPEE